MFGNIVSAAQRFIEEKKKQLKTVAQTVQKKFQPITSSISNAINSFRAPPVSPPLRNIPKIITPKPVVQPISKPLFTPAPRPVVQPVSKPLFQPRPVPTPTPPVQPVKPIIKPLFEEAKRQAGGLYTGLVEPMRVADKKNLGEQLGGTLATLPPSVTFGVPGMISKIPKVVNFLSKAAKEVPTWTTVSEKTAEAVRKGPLGKVPYVPETAGFVAPFFLGGVSPKKGIKGLSKTEVEKIAKKLFNKQTVEEGVIVGKEIVKKGIKKITPLLKKPAVKQIAKKEAPLFGKQIVKTGKNIYKQPPVEGGVGGIVTDKALVQEIRNSISEGQLILRTGSSNGKKLSPEEMLSVRKSVENSLAKIGESRIGNTGQRYKVEDVTPAGYGPEIPKSVVEGGVKEGGIKKVISGWEMGKGQTMAELKREAKQRRLQYRGTTPPLSPASKIASGGEVGQVVEQGLVKPKPLFQEARKVIKPLEKPVIEPKVIVPTTIQKTKYAFNINKQRLAIPKESKQFLDKAVKEIKPQLEAVKGKTLKNEEVIKAAQTSDMLRKVINREQTLQVEAQLLRLRQFVAEAAKNETVTPEFVEGLRVLSSQAADTGRTLQSFAIKAAGVEAPGIKEMLIKDLLDLGKKTDEIVNAAKGVNFNDLKQVTQFYRQFVKPTVPELIDEYRYINLLSSPQTQIVNAFSNLLQATIQAPITKLFSGSVDKIHSMLTGADRTRYVSEVPAYYKGAINSIGEGFTKFADVMKGKSLIERPDLARIPTGGIAPNKALQPMTWFTQKFQVIPRFMEGMDVLFRNIIKGGELESLLERAAKSGKQVDDIMLSKLQQEAEKKAQYFVFRAPVDATTKSGQGHLLRTIDQATSWIYQGRKIPGVKWFIPFVQTPMNILKQGIEYSPAGLFTLPGAVDKTEQLGKALMGSTVFMGAGYLIASNDSSWSAPISKKEKEAFYASGRQPYSIKIGDDWVSYNRLGPLAYPIAMAAAVKYYMEQDPKATTTEGYKKVANVIGGIARFFSDQSYMQGLGDFIKLLEADPRAVAEIVSNIPTQLIPLTSLLGWVNRNFLDPVYRNPKNIPEEIMLNIPFLSGGIEPYLNPKGQPSVRKNILFNAFSPVRVTPSDEEFNQLFKTQLEVSKVKKEKTKQKETDIERIMPLYEQVQVLKQTDIDAAEDLVNNLSDEDYKVYKSIKKTEQNKKTAAKKIEMFPVVRRVQELLKQGNRQEAERLVKELTDEEYVGYIKAKKELGIGEQPTGQPLFAQ